MEREGVRPGAGSAGGVGADERRQGEPECSLGASGLAGEARQHGVLEGRARRGADLAPRPGRERRRWRRGAERDAQARDQRRDRALLAVVAHLLPREHHAVGRAEELREQVALLRVAARLDRHVGQHHLEGSPQAIRKERVLEDGARKDVAVHAQHEELREALRARLGDAAQRDAAPSAERAHAGVAQRAPEQEPELRRVEREAGRELALQRRERRLEVAAAQRVAAPAERLAHERAQRGQLLAERRRAL